MTLKKIHTTESSTPKHFMLNNLLNIPKDGKIQLDKDKEAVYSYFIEDINKNTRHFGTLKEKIDFLVDEGYIRKDLIELYDFDFIKSLFKYLYDTKFRFNTFMGAYKFYTQYAMKDTNGSVLLERYEDRVAFNALESANGNEKLAMNLAEELITRRFQPSTPSFLNAGKVRAGEKVSCFLINVEDSMTSIGRSINSALQLSRIGGGCGINLTDIRPMGDPIKGVDGLTSGVVPVMKLYEDSFSYSNQMG